MQDFTSILGKLGNAGPGDVIAMMISTSFKISHCYYCKLR